MQSCRPRSASDGAIGGHGADLPSKVGDGGGNELIGGRSFCLECIHNSFKLIRNFLLPVSHDRKQIPGKQIQKLSEFVVAKVAGYETAA
ncbi:hypothetical protein, partial [Mesorhizobium sp. M5C.F.Ca.IN.020.29.1.1]|uniref:hypothetical protein n=1 Tax=Mesorhizobium sp. M5C.F.Ca.IN.020.29.1.1 TaxID=2496770 RepID=UPI0019D0E512